MDKIKRATEIHRTMTPHQMALRIVELQDALELAEEAVRAKQQPEALDGWKLVPVEPTMEMWAESGDAVAMVNGIAVHRDIVSRVVYDAMLAAAPKPEGGAA